MCEVIRFLGYKVMRLICCLFFLLFGYFVGSFCLLVVKSPKGGTFRVLSIKY